MNDYPFGNFLYTLRKEKQLSQTQLAQRLGVTNKAVSKWETGASKPNTVLIPKLAQILDVSVEELFAGRRFEESKELEQIRTHLAGQKIKYAVLSSVSLAMVTILPLLLIVFICVIMGFQLPDEVAGPVGSMGLVFAWIASVVAFCIYRSIYRNTWPLDDLMLKPSFVKRVRTATLLCIVGLISLTLATGAVCYLLSGWFHHTTAAAIFLSWVSPVLILLLGATVCLLRIKALLKIRIARFRAEREPVPFRQRPMWLKVCTVAAVALFPVNLCLLVTMQSRLKYGIMVIWMACSLVVLIKGFQKK